MRILLIIVFLLIGSYSCKMSTNDYSDYILDENSKFGEDLILNYSDTTAYHVWEDGSRSLQKGVFLKYISSEKTDTLFIWEGSIVIGANINKMIQDSIFIILDQKPLDSIWGPTVLVDSMIIREKQSDNYDEDMKLYYRSNIHSFWIINKVLKEVYGPMQKDEYEKKRKELKLPQELEFKEE